jgi:hypothetical protein
MVRKFLISWMLLFSASLWASTHYVCDFGSRVTITNSDIAKPKTKIINDSSRYTFIVPHGKTKGSYINLSNGYVLPISVNIKGGMTTFVEADGIDSGFIVSVFLNQGKSKLMPAIYSLHAYTDNPSPSESLVPAISIGTCRITGVR